MSKMTFLEALVDGVEVEWLPLGDVTRYEQPTKYLVASSNYSNDFDTPVLTAGKTFVLGYTDEVNDVYKASASPVIIFDDFTTANRWVDFDFKAKSSAMKMITSSDEGKVLLKYVYYWLNTLPSGLVEADHKRQWIGTFSDKKIPIPCPEDPAKSLDIQAKIVQILDNFSELTNELTNELTSRKKQYNYYRDQLLNFAESEVEWTTLGNQDLFEVNSGGTPSTAKPEYWIDGTVPWLKSESCNNAPVHSARCFITDIGLRMSSAQLLQRDTTLMALVGATIFKTAFLSFPAATNQNIAGIKSKNADAISDKFVFYVLTNMYDKLRSEMRNFDECHRSQFGEAQKNLKKRFKRFYQFGFTGTPIFPQNALGAETTASVFGKELHSYVITDAIRDEKVLKFKVDYNDVRPRFKAIEEEQDEKKLSAAENKQALLHPDRIREITQYVLNNYRQKTHRLRPGAKGFNAMFAVSSVDAAKLYYESFQNGQKGWERPLKVATIFSFAANEEQDAVGDIADESFEVSAMNSSAKEFLSAAIGDYNALFKTNFGVDSKEFQNYYRDLAKRVKSQEIDLLIVVGMFLTGFDAPTLNTLFVDKNLRYHGLIQAYSRTNRIYDATKTFGNVVTFRDLQTATVDAITLFGDTNTRNVVLEKSYTEYMQGFTDAVTGEARRGFVDVVNDLEQRFPDPATIVKESEKKAFVKLFGEYLRVENVLQNYDEFASLKALQSLDTNDPEAVESFKVQHYLTDERLAALQAIRIPSDRTIQNYRSTYNDIRDWLRREKSAAEREKSTIEWDDVVFEVDLLKSQEINLDYILELIFENNKKVKNKGALVEDVRRVIRASLGIRAKESLLVDFINQTDLDELGDKSSVIEAFFTFAQAEQQLEAQELIVSEGLNAEAARRYLTTSLKREFASENGTELNAVLPKMSPLNPQYLTKKQGVFLKVAAFVEKFKGVGGNL